MADPVKATKEAQLLAMKYARTHPNDPAAQAWLKGLSRQGLGGKLMAGLLPSAPLSKTPPKIEKSVHQGNVPKAQNRKRK